MYVVHGFRYTLRDPSHTQGCKVSHISTTACESARRLTHGTRTSVGQWSLVRETEGSDRHSCVRLRLRHRPRRPSRGCDIRRPWRSAPSFRAVLACCMPPGSFASALWSPQARSSRQRQAPAARPATVLATAWPPRTRALRRLSPRRWLTTSCRSLRRKTSCAPMHRHPGLYGRP